MKSFDLFDTLIFRKEKTPVSIFYIIGDSKFVKNRKEAEQRSRKKTLDDIYDELQTTYSWTDNEKNIRKQRELDCEYENLFPIISNVRKVGKDDIIISDMYLPLFFLQHVLKNKCGLDNKIYVSYDGKSSGWIWPEILVNHNLELHVGDNKHSDFLQPSKYNIKASLTDVSDYTKNERFWYDANFISIANCMRFSRLLCPYKDGLFKDIYMVNNEYNTPSLIMYCFYIKKMSKKYNKVVFSARDMCYCYFIYKKLFPKSNATMYLSNRQNYTEPTEDFNEYTAREIPENTLVTDLHGTGNSFRKYFIDTLKRKDVDILFLSSLLNVEHHFEYMNYVRFGSLNFMDKYNPVFKQLEYPIYIVYPIEQNILNSIAYLNPEVDIKDADFELLNIYVKSSFHNINAKKFLENIHVDGSKHHFAKDNGIDNSEYGKFNTMFNSSLKSEILVDAEVVNMSKETTDIPVYVISNDDIKTSTIIRILGEIGFKNFYVEKNGENTYYEILKNNTFEQFFIFEDNVELIYTPQDTKIFIDFIVNNYPQDADMVFLEYCDQNCKNEIFNQLSEYTCNSAIFYPDREKINYVLSKYFKVENKYLSSEQISKLFSNLIKKNAMEAYEHMILFKQENKFFCENMSNEDRKIYRYSTKNQEKENQHSRFCFIILLIVLLFFCFFFHFRKVREILKVD
jgi:hypothetical protein